MSIQETNDKFYKGLIEHYRNIGDIENANKSEDFYEILKANRKSLDEENKRIVNEYTK